MTVSTPYNFLIFFYLEAEQNLHSTNTDSEASIKSTHFTSWESIEVLWFDDDIEPVDHQKCDIRKLIRKWRRDNRRWRTMCVCLYTCVLLTSHLIPQQTQSSSCHQNQTHTHYNNNHIGIWKKKKTHNYFS